MAPNVGVVLSGCGVFDGSEIREAVLFLLALDMEGASFQCLAPDKAQTQVTNHQTGEASGESRNILVESARIARGKIKPLNDVKGSDFDALVFPGGFGAALNLCDFAVRGADCAIDPDVERLIREARGAGRPICYCCIAPALGAKALANEGTRGVRMTVGEPSEASAQLEKLGQEHVACAAADCVVDEANRIVTTPAYMYDDARLGDIFQGVRKAVQTTLRLASTRPAA